MMTGKDLVQIVQKETNIPIEPELESEFDQALREDRVYFLPGGFITYDFRSKGLLINKCVIRKQYRNRFTFLALRQFFRSFGLPIYWKSRKHNRLCFVK